MQQEQGCDFGIVYTGCAHSALLWGNLYRVQAMRVALFLEAKFLLYVPREHLFPLIGQVQNTKVFSLILEAAEAAFLRLPLPLTARS